MSSKRYDAAWAKIGNAAGFRFSAGLFRDNPQLRQAKGIVEVLNSNTLLVRLQPQSSEEDEDELMLSLFLDFLLKKALSDPKDELEAYTAEMAAEDDELITGVELDR
jgi:antitoxin PrlF